MDLGKLVSMVTNGSSGEGVAISQFTPGAQIPDQAGLQQLASRLGRWTQPTYRAV